jgi:hypothetical protein
MAEKILNGIQGGEIDPTNEVLLSLIIIIDIWNQNRCIHLQQERRIISDIGRKNLKTK